MDVRCRARLHQARAGCRFAARGWVGGASAVEPPQSRFRFSRAGGQESCVVPTEDAASQFSPRGWGGARRLERAGGSGPVLPVRVGRRVDSIAPWTWRCTPGSPCRWGRRA